MNLDLQSKNVFVLGAGGLSGIAILRLVGEFSKNIYIYDDNKNINFNGNIQNFSFIDSFDLEDICKNLDKYHFDYCFISPGFPRSSLFAKYFEERQIPVIGELDLGYYFINQYTKPFIVAITGTDGKSTTTNLTAELFRSQNIKAIECGNYGKPLSELALEYKNNRNFDDVLVVECSSYQLEKLYFFRPDVGMLLNLAEDHLDRYEDLKEYLKAKLNMIQFMNKENYFLTSKQVYQLMLDMDLISVLNQTNYKILDFENLKKECINIFNIPFYWKNFPVDNNHNRMNLSFAIEALEIYFKKNSKKIIIDNVLSLLSHYRGLPHRMEKIKEINNILFIDDSKSTTVQSLLSALETFKNYKIFLLIGGVDKNLNFNPINDLQIKKENRLKIYPYGSAAEKIKNQLNLEKKYTDMEQAFLDIIQDIHQCKKQNQKETYIVLLSPACASFDQYKNYHERGEYFRSLVNQYIYEFET